jgi:hypothetical protein
MVKLMGIVKNLQNLDHLEMHVKVKESLINLLN